MAISRPNSTSGRSNAVVLILTVLLLLVGTELVLRVFYRPEMVKSAVRYDPLVGWSLIPGASIQTNMTERGIRNHIDIDSYGLREREFPVHSHAHRRILILGDSIAFGSGLDYGERFSEVLGHELGDSTEVINAGIPGWGNDQEMLFYEKRLRALRPDVVMLVFTGGNDVVNNALSGALLEGGTKPRFQLSANDSLVLTPPAPPVQLSTMVQFKHLLHKSRLLVFARRRLMRLTYRRHVHAETSQQLHGFESYRDLSHWSVYENPPDDATAAAWKVTEAILSRLAADCRADSARFMIFAMPLKLEVDDAWREHMIKGTNADASRLDMGYPYRRLSAYCAAHGIEFHYPIDQFRAAAAHDQLYFKVDSHPNVRGNQVAADCMREILHS
ncbi:MAG TPA: SGNH/GDSL hydrolase family protein [Candidatus Krumholzibacteria bacterium]|nr:SGNH/GDSL hydrolase family protein [Candidatus Krumholzibacteria bacterium]